MAGPTTIGPGGGGRFDFDDGGAYCGGWADGKAHGHGVCTGPKGQGEFRGAWAQGFEQSGVYRWPAGHTYEGQWSDGKRQGLGIESRGRWIYRGEWTEGYKGRYGCKLSISSPAKYDGTWANGLQDGYGSETYADGGTFQGQWAKGQRHGYGVRSSAPFGLAAHARRQQRRASADDGAAAAAGAEPPEEGRGGFVLKDRSATLGRSLPEHGKKSAFKGLLSKRKSGDRNSFETEGSDGGSDATDSSFVVPEDEPVDGNVIETYMGEWKNDKRSGFGIAERSDGVKYEGEWYNNKKFGYGRTTYRNGLEERGKYKNNVLLASGDKKHLFLLRSAKFRERVEAAVNAAHRSSQIALQKADIAISRTATARGKAEQANEAAKQARNDADIAVMVARQYAPEFHLEPSPGYAAPRKFDSTEFHPEERPAFSPNLLSPEPPQQQSAFLGLFSNNPDRRPSFARRASTARRPSAILLPSPLLDAHFHKPDGLLPSQPQQHYYQGQQQQQYLGQQQQQYFGQQQYYNGQQQQQYYQPPQLSLQEVLDDHFNQYYDPENTPSRSASPSSGPRRPAIDLTELSKLYGIPLSRPLMSEEEENSDAPFIPQRRLTMPTVLDGQAASATDPAVARHPSLYGGRKNAAAAAGGEKAAPARKKSLPDITQMEEPRTLSREAIAALSHQRRETIRQQEEEAMRLRANPLLYLVSPEVWDWFASQQLVFLVIIINAALGFLFFKVIL